MPHDCRFCICVPCFPWDPLVHNFRHPYREEACECTRCPHEKPLYPNWRSQPPVAKSAPPPEAPAPGVIPSTERPRPRTFILTGNIEIAPSIHELTFEVSTGDRLDFQPGQYVTFNLRREGRPVMRSYSIFSSPNEHRRFSLLVKEVPNGFGSRYLCRLDPRPRPSVSALGPLGRFVLHNPEGRAVVLVATGVGLAPFLPMLEQLRTTFPHTPVWLFHGSRYVEELVDRNELADLERSWPNFHFVPVISRPPSNAAWSGAIGHVEEHVQLRFPDLSEADVYLCGANRMVNEMQELSIGLHCPREHVFVDRWGDHPD
jgi:ferredoxin-NADP reductase